MGASPALCDRQGSNPYALQKPLVLRHLLQCRCNLIINGDKSGLLTMERGGESGTWLAYLPPPDHYRVAHVSRHGASENLHKAQRRTLARDAHRVLRVAAYEFINVAQSFWQWFSVGVAPVAPEAETC